MEFRIYPLHPEDETYSNGARWMVATPCFSRHFYEEGRVSGILGMKCYTLEDALEFALHSERGTWIELDRFCIEERFFTPEGAAEEISKARILKEQGRYKYEFSILNHE